MLKHNTVAVLRQPSQAHRENKHAFRQSHILKNFEELIDQGLTTKFILWLDNLVQRKLLVPSNGATKAVGALLLADPLIEKIQ